MATPAHNGVIALQYTLAEQIQLFHRSAYYVVHPYADSAPVVTSWRLLSPKVAPQLPVC